MSRFNNDFENFSAFSNEKLAKFFAEPGYSIQMTKHMNSFGEDKWWCSSDARVIAFKQMNYPKDMIVLPSVLCAAVSIVLQKGKYLTMDEIQEDWNDLRKEVNKTLAKDDEFMEEHGEEVVKNDAPIQKNDKNKVIIDWD
jgi:hypothetical protein